MILHSLTLTNFNLSFQPRISKIFTYSLFFAEKLDQETACKRTKKTRCAFSSIHQFDIQNTSKEADIIF